MTKNSPAPCCGTTSRQSLAVDNQPPAPCCGTTSRQSLAVDNQQEGAGAVVQAHASPSSTQMNIAKTKPTLENMVYIPKGEFLMGTDSDEGFPADGEGPVHKVSLDAFYISRHSVTNAEFAAFVDATGYQTDAEKYGWSFVFYSFLDASLLDEITQYSSQAPWWIAVKGATWRTPEGPDSDIADRLNHPVVHVSWNDAMAYCAWVGMRLPTEAEWEYAARGGLVQKRYAWGDILRQNGQHHCNIWQGKFPQKNTGSDGYLGTCPVDAFEPNGYGLHNVCGNVWEWCADWFANDYYRRSAFRNPKGPAKGMNRIIRGGSYLCHDSYCNRYRVAARSSNTPDSSAGHTGFRCVTDTHS
ncbi:formylglycine-generating enzyme family protein [Alicyclobacillus fodiniaquatilis]|uniref:Formylglycine-generating enzyme family protein n=1 Tax=Alicyclobacillus fodiniaquatilis TaxID=1661150 RepID=A0ABW4JKW2_9BACL